MHDVLCNEHLLKLLFDCFSQRDCVVSEGVCQLWRNVANSDEIWSSLDSGVSMLPAHVPAALSLQRKR